MNEITLWIWRTLIIVCLVSSCFYAYKDDKYEQIVCLLLATFGCVGPLAFYVLR